jgi:Protein of unknown function (DUF3305)
LSVHAVLRIPVGVVVERHRATSPWLDFVWRPVSVLPGIPAAKPWTPLGPVGDTTTFFAGTATIALHRTETANYIDNLSSGAPLLWVVLRPTEAQPPYEVLAVTADPAEGEAFTEAGNDLVETVPMPADIEDVVAAFVAEHHVDRAFFKRRRDTDNASGQGSRRKERWR